MIFKSFAKINLSLGVNKKLKNNLHDINSFYCQINLNDKIKIEKNKNLKDFVIFKGKFIKGIKKQKNSIKQTLEILRKNEITSEFYTIQVEKKIPIYSGLGGGTSNAFYLTRFLTKGVINKSIINLIEKKIGSDFKLFNKKQGFLKNLKDISGLKKKINLHFILVYPNIKCSTKFIYSKVNRYSSKSKYNINKVYCKEDFISLISNLGNDLQSIVEKKYPLVKKILLDIEQLDGCYFSRMTGSGSACYGVFKSEKRAKDALNKIKLKYPKFWTTFAKTI